MSLLYLKEFISEIITNNDTANELKKLRLEEPLNTSETIDNIIIPFAMSKGFEFNIEDIISLYIENALLSESNLQEVSGGIFKEAISSALAPIQITNSPNVISMYTSNINSSFSIFQNQNSTEYNSRVLLDFIKDNPNLPEISEEHPYNEVDGLILAALSYMPLNFVPTYGDNHSLTINDLSESLISYINGDRNIQPPPPMPAEQHTMDKFIKSFSKGQPNIERDIIKLLQLVAKSPRYREMKIGDAYCKFEKKLEVGSIEQFAGVTFSLPGHLKVVAIRGTDDTLSGWKEDIDLTWSNNVQSQMHAYAYLGGISTLHPESKISVTGHSKGGHLSAYSAIRLSAENSEFRDKIISVYNFDGPGIRKDILDTYRSAYNIIKKKIITYIPQTSIIGVILNNNNENDGGTYKYVQSDNQHIKQHDIFSWRINSKCMNSDSIKFIPPVGNTTDNTSKLFESTLRKTLNKISYKKISTFSNALFKVFGYEDPDAILLSDTLYKNFKNSNIISNLSSLSKDELNAFVEIIGNTLKNFSESIKDSSMSNKKTPLALMSMLLMKAVRANNQLKSSLSKENYNNIIIRASTEALKFFDSLIQ